MTTAKDIFDAVKSFIKEEKVFGVSSDIKIYLHHIKPEKFIQIDKQAENIKYRVNCGKEGSFDVSENNGGQYFATKLDEHIFFSGKYYSFYCCGTTYAGIPLISIERALEILNTKKTR
jgi:hypothetical protein